MFKGFTAKYNVDELVYFEEYSKPRLAIEREKEIKGWKRIKKDKLINEFNPEWKELYQEIT